MPDWLIIFVVFTVIVLSINPSPRDFGWFRIQRRPPWLSVFVWLPVFWLLIEFSVYLSAVIVWERLHNLPILVAYGLVILLQECRTWLMCRHRSFALGSALQLAAWICACVLSARIAAVDRAAILLLLPMLLWSPLELIALHQMHQLNQD